MTDLLTSRPTAPAAADRPALPLFDVVDEAFVAHYAEHGFALLAGALTPEQVAAINADALRLCRGDYGDIGYGWSGDGENVPVADLSDEEVLRRYLCIHYPHKVSPPALEALTVPRVVDALVSVIGPNVKAMQSMLFVKSEGKPGQAWHQDEYFIPTRDRSLTAVWIALDDATVENGCLWVLPGSHRRGVIYPERDQDDPRFDCSSEAYDFPYTDEQSVPVEIPAGTALVFNGYLLHRSLENSGKHGYRRALANHYMSAESLLPWRPPAEGEHMAMTDYRDVVLVAGEDPYAWKGTTDLARPYSRPDKDGGCDR
ncbi:phytanoyl-CoA dioxygenase family protein [Microlunatus capsulatus]|uniref:Ectoine hydroxylase-related dioxygenase (Phytanoyl-CoA dioxygenase family) n=1 Tax=Microlunatus capsulatus TaxID=99117 RepID=A0ABS4Z6Y0_9ACTN|nr:phytanoyl-CoA dioxygenase family protein [Microlunatus capsulatus]MBP2416749.1 ectoine hydroxylase-related dioxygenase (phytanoyl-CoA dioxygenase family) [Microlunatus capsulatus]